MQVSLFNSMNPNGKRVPVTITIEQVDILSTNDGELIYLITLVTGIKSKTGKKIDPVYLNNVVESSIMSELNRGLSTIGDSIDWGVLEEDKSPPIISFIDPPPNTSGISIQSNVLLHLLDPNPTSFLDPSTIKLKVNDLDVTPDLSIKDKNGKFKLLWIPKRILS